MPVESTSKSYCSNKSCPLSLSSSRNSLWLLHHSKKEFRFCLHGQHAQRSNKASTILLGCGMWEVTGWDWNRNDFFCIHVLCISRIYTPLYEETFYSYRYLYLSYRYWYQFYHHQNSIWTLMTESSHHFTRKLLCILIFTIRITHI